MSQADVRLFLGMPGYGHLTAGAARGFWRATRSANAVLHYQEGSLLAHNFNILWCQALNLQGDNAPQYFAMQHADVEPQDFWLDALIEELEVHALDVLGVAIPIKDGKGLTSIALARPDDTWRPLCRLTMREVYDLPETFTSDDTGHPLLLNTGLWVCRFDPSWTNQARFEINDRIVQDRKTGRYIPQVEPEDWFFSRLLHEQGLRIGCTRKIAAMHHGNQRYPNTQPWGCCEFDTDYVNESQIPNPQQAVEPATILTEV